MGTVVLMIKTQIGLGVLSIPSAFDALGLIPGVICLLAIGGTITWGNHVVGIFKRNHPDVYSIVDVGYKLGGKFGQEFMSVAFMLCKFLIPVTRNTVLSLQKGGSVSRHLDYRVSQPLSTPFHNTELVPQFSSQ